MGIGTRWTRAGGVAVIVLVSLSLAHPASAADWNLQLLPTLLTPNGQLSAVSCAGESSCEATGYRINSQGAQVALAEGQSGSGWSLQAVPEPAGATGAWLSGTSCKGAACTAVGAYIDSAGAQLPLAVSWTGTSWSLQQVPLPAGAAGGALDAVSCQGAGACVAVGSYLSSSGETLALAASLAGSIWSDTHVPAPAGATGLALNGVSCPAADACTAVGAYSTSAGGSTPTAALAEGWNGKTWAQQKALDPAGASVLALDAVSCTATNACTAVGAYATGGPSADQTLAERWDGSGWAIQTTQSPSGGSLSGASVSCAAANTCMAVWWEGFENSIAEQWSAGTWSSESTPTASDAYGTELIGVTCASAENCTTVGSVYADGGTLHSLAEHWNGTSWAFESLSSAAGAAQIWLDGLSCGAVGGCMAVGYYIDSAGEDVPVSETWNGTEWSVGAPAVPASSIYSALQAVSCWGPSACAAVGDYFPGDVAGLALAEGWDGTSWTIEKTPDPTGALGTTLGGVSCTAQNACFAVGTYLDSAREQQPLAEQWNGSAWTIRTTPAPSGATNAVLNGVSCTTQKVCVAAGSYTNSAGEFSFAERWNGTAWAVQSTPDPSGATSNYFRNVSCSAPNACTAVGGYSTATVSGDLADRWNGTKWSLQTTPSNEYSVSGFSGVSCAGTLACTAAGGSLAESWNGTSWTPQPIFLPASGFLWLSGVACTGSSQCIAGGYLEREYVLTTAFAGEFPDYYLVNQPLAEQQQ